MKRRLVLALALGVVATVSLTTAVHALTVQINGTTVPSNVPSDDPLTVTLSEADGSAHTYDCFKVEALDKTLPPPNNRARVRALDSTQDTLVFDNALIKAITANCLRELYAWHTFSQADGVPTTSGTTGVRFKRQVAAQALRGVNAATGNEMWTTGWVPGTPINEVGLTYYRKFPAGDPNFNNTQQEDCVAPACTITGQRDMKWWLKFNLKMANDQIKLTTLQVFTSIVSDIEEQILPRGAKVGPYESFEDDEPCAGKDDKKKDKGGQKHEKKDDRH